MTRPGLRLAGFEGRRHLLELRLGDPPTREQDVTGFGLGFVVQQTLLRYVPAATLPHRTLVFGPRKHYCVHSLHDR